MQPENGDGRSGRRRALAAIAALLAAGCAQPPPAGGRGEPPRGSGFRLQNFAKGDLDMVAEVHARESFATLRVLTVKLYKRNPREWRRGGQPGLEAAVARLFDTNTTWIFPELEGRQGTDAIHLAFREDFAGDRVLAFMGGLSRMVAAAFNDKTEFYLTDELDPQKLYNAARNCEMAAWKLANSRNAAGQLFLLSNELDWNNRNLSFEREFGRLIGQLDLLSVIMAERSGRTVVKVVINLATGLFLPVPVPVAR